jgi:molybdopterin-synthase adenylyltransferase
MLSKEQLERYRAQLPIGQVGAAGQERLGRARVLVVGIGGLGSPAALYLTAAGVGTVGLCDPDRVDLSNLQRQVIHSTLDLGSPKVDSAARKLRALNPDVLVRAHPGLLTAENALRLFEQYDFIVDATDNFQAKFLINDAAYFADRPFCHAGVLRFAGQLLTVRPRQTACVRCLFESPPPPGSVPSPAEAGVFGPLPGVFGALQAVEALKCLLGIEPLLTNVVLTFDALRPGFRHVELHKNPRCPLCGEAPSITDLGP